MLIFFILMDSRPTHEVFRRSYLCRFRGETADAVRGSDMVLF